MSVRRALLGLLHQRPRHGYDLKQAFEAVAGGPAAWEIKPAQVYQTLSRLERDGFIEPVETKRLGGPDRVVYQVTEAGRAELQSWFSEGVHGEHVRDAFFVKLMVAIGCEGVDVRDLVRVQRGTLYRDLHALTTRRAAFDRSRDLARVMLLDKAVMHLEADLRWLDMVESRLAEIERQPIPLPAPRRRGRPPKSDVATADTDPPGDSPGAPGAGAALAG